MEVGKNWTSQMLARKEHLGFGCLLRNLKMFVCLDSEACSDSLSMIMVFTLNGKLL